MEFWRYLKESVGRSRETRAAKRKLRSLESFFGSSAGAAHLEHIQKEWNIQEIKERRIAAIDNENEEFRLIITVGNGKFVDIAQELKPGVVKYRVTNQTDTMDAGYLLIELDGKTALQSFGIIFPQASGVRGVLSELKEARYMPVRKNYPGFEPWKELGCARDAFLLRPADASSLRR